MKNYMFLKKTFEQDGITRYYAISKNSIETINVSDTYDSNGQAVDHSDAGDSITLESDKAVSIANKIKGGHIFKEGDFVSAYDNSDAFRTIIEELQDNKDYIKYFPICKGFNYWDGSNWKSIIISYNENDYSVDWEIETDKKLVASMNRAIDNMKHVKDGFGIFTYRTTKYEIEESVFASVWEAYKVMHIEDVERLENCNF